MFVRYLSGCDHFYVVVFLHPNECTVCVEFSSVTARASKNVSVAIRQCVLGTSDSRGRCDFRVFCTFVETKTSPSRNKIALRN